MRTVGLKILKNKLAEYVRLADAVIAGMVREGLVTPPLWPGKGLAEEHPRGARLAEILEELERDRGDR